MMPEDFEGDLGFSRGRREVTDMETLKAHIPGCVGVEKTGEDADRLHVDYVAHLRRGAVLHIDGKARRKGAAKFWKPYVQGRRDVPSGEPDLAIEILELTLVFGHQPQVEVPARFRGTDSDKRSAGQNQLLRIPVAMVDLPSAPYDPGSRPERQLPTGGGCAVLDAKTTKFI